MINKQTIEHIESRAAGFKNPIDNTDHKVLFAPTGFEFYPLEKFNTEKDRFTGKFRTSDINDFGAYYDKHNQQSCSTCFVHADDMTAKVIYDLGDQGEPLHGEHTAILTMQKTAAFESLKSITKQKMSQREAAEWLEDWREYLNALDAKGNLVDIKKAILAIRNLTFEETTKTDYSENDYRSTRSAMEEIEIKSENGLPSKIVFKTVPYHGLKEREFVVRIYFSQHPSAKGPEAKFRFVQFEKENEEMADEFKVLLKDKLGQEANIFVGTFE